MSRPAWARAASIYDYGGHPDKKNYMDQALINALTDFGKDEINRIASDQKSMVNSAPFLVARLTLADTVPDDPTVHWCLFQPAGQSVNDFAGDAPPTGFPTFTRLGGGYFKITFDASYSDEYSNQESTVLRAAAGSGAGSTYANVQGQVTSDTIAEFNVFDASGTQLDDATITVRVY